MGAHDRRDPLTAATAAQPAPADGTEALIRASAALFGLALQNHRQGRLDQAETLCRALLQVRPEHADGLHLLGVLAYQQGRNDEAIDLIGRARRLDGDRADYASNLGNALQRALRLGEAEAHYRAAIALNPEGAAAHCNLGAVLHAQGRTEAAIESCRTALRLRPGYLDARNNLAVALSDLGRFDEALEHFRAALALDAERAETRNNIANVLAALGRFDEALDQYDAALARQPEIAAVRHNRGTTLLRVGRFAEGWRDYEWRWRTQQLAASRRDFVQPQWDGAPLGPRILLVHAEQGFGDTLQFCRYAARVDGRVVVEVQPALVGLLRGRLGACRVVAQGEPLPAFDLHCPMLSLPALIEDAPDPAAHAAPYLAADPVRGAAWRARIAALPGLRVGLVWAGGARPGQPGLANVDRRRSTTLAALAPLAEVRGVSFVSLQKGPPAAQAAAPPAGMTLHDFTEELSDFAETAALVEALDLVISVDTAVAHLAGALGKPVWLLNRFDSCWRWGAEGADSLWYPSLRQFRQPRPGDWAAVAADAAAALGDAADGSRIAF
jgi:tetratricopeptide (TPR) repeat protein